MVIVMFKLGASLLVGLSIIFGLTGCTTASKSAAIVADPDIKVGASGNSAPSTIALSFYADRDVNENYLGEGTPIDFHVIYMKDDSKMLSADFDQLIFEMEESLGKNYLSHDDFTLIPDQYKYVEASEIPDGTRYIGLIARYSDPNQTQWKKSMRVKTKGRNYNFLVQLKRENVNFQKEDY